MKHNLALTTASLLSILLFGVHWAYEVAHGWETGGPAGLGGILIMVVWLYGTVVLGERRSGYIIMLIGGIQGLGVLGLHMMGVGINGGRAATSSSIFFWVSTLIALGVTGLFAALLSVHGLLSLRRGATPAATR
jgi:hypothetical protein